MSDASVESLYQLPAQVSDFVALKRRQSFKTVLAGILVTLLMGGVYLIGNGNIILPLAPLIFVSIVVLLWSYPSLFIPFTVLCACLFETNLTNFADSATDRVPLFWDVNTIFQIYGHLNFHGVALSMYEMFMIVAVLSALLRGIYFKTLNLQAGAFILPVMGFIACVVVGILNGAATGGDMKIALFEVRAQFYIFLAYIFTTNLKQDVTTTVRTAMWITAICVGIKGVLLTARYYITLGGQTNPDLGVGAHEESFFFDEYVLLYAVLVMAQIEPKMRRTMLCFLPFVIMANLANERRAATAAMIFAIPMLLALSCAAFPQRRLTILKIVIGAGLVLSVYLPAFWNGDGVIAQPARAIKSQWTPDDRDNSSDLYRIAEDANLMATMRTSPVIGYGYGKEIMIVAPMADVKNFDPLVLYLTHDQILWEWMRLGFVGFLAFWIMVVSFIIKCTQLGTDTGASAQMRALGVFAALSVIMLMFFGLLDLQLSNVRDVLFTATWLGFASTAIRNRQAELARIQVPRFNDPPGSRIPRRLGQPMQPLLYDGRITHGHVTNQAPAAQDDGDTRQGWRRSDGNNNMARR